MSKLDDDDGAASRAATTLNRIASALGCPVSAFSEQPSSTLAETHELLRLWSLIEHQQDRAKVLAFIRNAAVSAPLMKAAG